LDDDEWTANVESSRQTSPELHDGHSGLVPLRTNSSKVVPHWLQQNS